MQASIAFSLPRLVTDPPGLGFHEALFSICKAASHMRAALDVYDPSALDALGEITIELPPAIYHWARMVHHGDTGRSVLEFMAANFPSIRFARETNRATMPRGPIGGAPDSDDPIKVAARIQESMHALRATFGGAADAERNVAATAARLLHELLGWLPAK